MGFPPSLTPRQDFAAQNYGNLPLNQSQERTGRQFHPLTEVSASNDGKDIIFTARIQTARSPSGEYRERPLWATF